MTAQVKGKNQTVPRAVYKRHGPKELLVLYFTCLPKRRPIQTNYATCRITLSTVTRPVNITNPLQKSLAPLSCTISTCHSLDPRMGPTSYTRRFVVAGTGLAA